MIRFPRTLTLSSIALSIALFACEGKKPGDPCDKFFQNQCSGGMSCISQGDKKVCAGTCSLVDTKEGGMKQGCTDPGFQAVQVQVVTSGGASVGGAGCYCLPK